jgi:hypothetical protein
MKKRFAVAGILSLAASASVQGAVVTYTMVWNQGASFAAVANQYSVWATVSKNDNAGLFAFGVDLKAPSEGGPTTMTLVNRSPNGTWDIDDTDPNYDGGIYPTKYAGFGTGRGASAVTGVVSGVQDLAKDADLIRIYGLGQVGLRMNDFKPPPENGTLGPIPYKTYAAAANTDSTTVIPTNCAALPAGSVRLATGSWTGARPTIDALSVNTKASVWKVSHPNGNENEIANLQISYTDCLELPSPFALGSSAVYPNRAVGGAVSVSGANGSYVSEVDPLVDPPANNGSAPIQTIGDEAGNIYVMVKLLGSQADIDALLGVSVADVSVVDPQYAPLHAAYDAQFGPGGFNALFRFNNVTGAKVFNWNFEGTVAPNVTVDQIAAVPEPSVLGLLLPGIALLARRRRAGETR